MSDQSNPKIDPNHNEAIGGFGHNYNEPPSAKIVVGLVAIIVVIGVIAFYSGVQFNELTHEQVKTEAGNDAFTDFGVHNVHNGDCYIVKEFLTVDGQLHVEFEVTRTLELQFELLDSAGFGIWKSPVMKDAPGHHELRWDPVHRDGRTLEQGTYKLAVETEGQRLILGEYVHRD